MSSVLPSKESCVPAQRRALLQVLWDHCSLQVPRPPPGLGPVLPWRPGGGEAARRAPPGLRWLSQGQGSPADFLPLHGKYGRREQIQDKQHLGLVKKIFFPSPGLESCWGWAAGSAPEASVPWWGDFSSSSSRWETPGPWPPPRSPRDPASLSPGGRLGHGGSFRSWLGDGWW